MTPPKIKFNILFKVILAAFLMSCSDKDETTSDIEPTAPLPFQELYDQGVDKYLGTITPISSTSVGAGVTEHKFSNADGPVCFTGNEFSMFTRDGSSDNLLIFLQGGGFCSPVACAAIPTPIPLVPFGILSPSDAQNPAVNYDVGYVPYCDGSSMMGDNEVDSDGDGVNDRFFKGIHNLSASLDVIFKEYPSPSKIVLAGNSAGGFAVHAALPLVRKLYPNVKIEVINDSGQGILNAGGMEILVNYWKADIFFPASCTDCIGTDGNLTDYHKYQLNQDPNIRLAYISSKQDSTFSMITAGGAEAFEAQLLEATAELNAAFPDRFGSLIADGNDHTFIIRRFDTKIGGISVKDWISQMLNEDENWKSLSD